MYSVSHSYHSHPACFAAHQHLTSQKPSVRPSQPALILVVDDEPHIVDFLSLLLEDEGYRVRQARNGREALSAIEQEPPHLIISDVMMPDVNGVELVQQLERLRSEPQPKVILMSAVSRSAPSPAIPFIEKPFDIDDILDIVGNMLEDEERSA
jgi:DNA-binding NtrC family response regulator